MAESTTATATRKVVINRQHGGFGVTVEAARRMAELGQPLAIQAVREYDSLMAHWRRTGINHRWEDSKSASDYLLKGEPEWWGRLYDEDGGEIARDDEILVRVIEEMGAEAANRFAELKIVEIPADASWHVEDYDGMEWIAEDHRTWN
jgi:hypothetical protein